MFKLYEIARTLVRKCSENLAGIFTGDSQIPTSRMTYAFNEEKSVYGVAYTCTINVSNVNWGTSDQVMRINRQGARTTMSGILHTSHSVFCTF